MQQEKAIISERYQWLEATGIVCILATTGVLYLLLSDYILHASQIQFVKPKTSKKPFHDQHSLAANNESYTLLAKPAQKVTVGPKIDLEDLSLQLQVCHLYCNIQIALCLKSCLQGCQYAYPHCTVERICLITRHAVVYDTLHANVQQVTKFEELTRKQANSKNINHGFDTELVETLLQDFKLCHSIYSTNVAQSSQLLAGEKSLLS